MFFFTPYIINKNKTLIKPKRTTKNLKKMNTSTVLTRPNDFKKENVIFSKPSSSKIPNSTMTYTRVHYSIKNPDGSVGDLVIPTSSLFSFGASENTSLNNPEEVTGYSMSLCLTDRENPSEEEESFIRLINDVVELSKDYALTDEVKKASKMYDLERSDLRKMDPIYRKRVDGKIDKNSSPLLYPKFSTKKDKKTGAIRVLTPLYAEGCFEPNGDPTELELKDVLGVYCNVTAAIKFESIYFGGGKVRIQLKMVEADIRLQNSGKSRLLRAPKKRDPQATLENNSSSNESEEEELELSD